MLPCKVTYPHQLNSYFRRILPTHSSLPIVIEKKEFLVSIAKKEKKEEKEGGKERREEGGEEEKEEGKKEK